MKTITILLLALCLFGQAQAIDQPSESSNEIPLELKQASILLNADTYSVPEGLSQSTVTSLVEDKDGYVWIGTLNGLNRFDGKDFKHYFADDSYSGLPSSFIRSLLIDNKGNLLVGTDKGLVMLDRTIDKFVPISKELISKKLPIWSLMIIGNNIVVGTNKKIININKDNFSINSIIESDLFDGIKTIIKNNNAYLVRNYNGDIIDEIENKIIVKNSKNILKYNKTIIVNGEFGLSTVQGNKIIQVNPMQFDTIFILKKTLHGMIGNKLYSIDYNFTPSLSGIITNLDYTLDKPLVFPETNSLFVSTQNMGFIQIREKLNIIKKSSENTNNIWSINKEKNIKLTIATDSNIVSVYDSSNNIKKYDSSITGAKTAITYRRKLYVGSTSGLFSIDLLSNEREILTNHPVSALKFNEFNNTILAGTTDGLLLVVQPLTNTIINRLPVDIGNPIFDISSYNDSVFVSSQGGLFEINKDNSKPVYTDDIVFSVKNTSNKVFFGTTKSLMVYNKENNHHEVIYSNNLAVFSISSENDKLIATSMGEVIYINKESLYILDDTIGSQDEYNTQSSLYWKNKFIFGGINGVSILIPKDIDSYISETSTPKVKIEDLLVFNIVKTPGDGILSKPISISEQVSLKYSDYPFTFKFWSPSNHLGEIDFLYQMEGLSDSWIESKGVNSATYTNLSPGEYTFNIYAVDRFLSKKGDIKRLKVIITPPWWLSKQAKFVYFMLSLITSAIIVKAILRRREVQNQIAKSEERLKLSLWGSGDEMWDWDIETGQIYRSNIWGSLEFPRDGQRSGETGEESNIHPMDQERVSTALNDHFYGKSDHFEAAYRVKGKSDDWVWILDRAKIVERDEKDNPLRMTGTIKNINNFKHAEEQLRLFERAIANISEGMFILDSEFRFVEVNEACCELCLKPRDKFIGEQFNFDLYPDSYSEQIRTILHQQGRWSNDVDSAKGDGSSFLMELTVDAIYDELGQLSHYVGVFSDISRRKQQEEELRKLTNNDLLTNLPNRSSLMVTLGNLVKRDSHHTLMVLDLDNFKKINDSLGHQVGDELLIKVARRIETAVPYHTSIYRLGGDEFAILVDDNPDIGSSAVIANSVIEAFVTPFELTSDKVVVGMSIGIVLYPEDDQNEQALLRKADIAMYHAKSAGGNRYQFYSESLNRNAIRQLEVENLIRQGIKEDLFEVYYQPKIDLKSGKMAGMEALVRLNHPEQGLIPPSEFIPLAEENGLIVEIGDIVMKKACFAAQKWRSQGIFNGRVAVNLSSYQFALPDLQQRIESILRLTQLPAANLELEITEGTVIKEPEKAIKVMQQLSKMGVTLALDDFGTGYSSLSYLKRFPIHTLKIDKAFVDDIDKSDRDLKMVDSIITIAHNMGLSVVGEGVEDASQLSILKALNCEEIQGFIFSKPVSEAEFTKLLHKEFIEPDLVQNGKKAI